jgi:signal transduction histidine kinase
MNLSTQSLLESDLTSTPSLASLTERILQTSPRPTIVCDLSWHVLIANRAFYRNFALSPDVVEHCQVDELPFAKASGANFRDQLREVLEGTAPAEQLRFSCHVVDVGPRTYLIHPRRIDDASGAPQALLLELDDVTSQERDRAVIDRHTAELERSNTDLEQFAYVASHDLQEPLRMVGSYTQLLAERYRGKLDADADVFIGYAVNGVHRMQALVDGLLAYSRVDRRAGNFKETNCNDILELVLSDLQQVIAECNAHITSDTLPTLKVDTRQMGQLFQNLLSNGLKFHRQEVTPEMHISARQQGSDWLFSFKDNGIGIPAGHRQRLFQLF